MAINVKELRVVLSITDKQGELPVLRDSPPPPVRTTIVEYEETPGALEIFAVGHQLGQMLLFCQESEEAQAEYPLTAERLYALTAAFDLEAEVLVYLPDSAEPSRVWNWITLDGDLARSGLRLALVAENERNQGAHKLR